MTPEEKEKAVAALIAERRDFPRFGGRRSIDKSCGEVFDRLTPCGDEYPVIERIPLPNFQGEEAACKRATELSDLWAAQQIIELLSR